jgi:photosystem II stability/assembly factor-like uncharacterized protein
LRLRLAAVAVAATCCALPRPAGAMQDMENALGAFAWRDVGPAVAGGRTAAVSGSNLDPYLYYFGSAGGGVFKTTNAGLTWRAVWPREAAGAIGAVTIAPSNKDVVWAGTGEAAPRNDASYGDGIWVTRDGGATWTHRGLSDTYAISKIVVDPRDPNVALAGALGNPFVDTAARGVYRTTDGGRTWTKTLYAGPASGISDMDYDPAHPNVVYAGVWQFRREPWSFASGGAADGIYKSTDGGRTWRRLAGRGLPPGPLGRIGIAVAPSRPQRVYADIQSRAGFIWRSDDGGNSWKLLSKDTLIDQRPFYMSRLAVDPSNADRVFFASENLLETRDGGATFEDVADAVHQDHHGFWISRDGRRIIEANDGGAPISIDGGKTWDWRFNVDLAQIYHVGYDDRDPYDVCAAMQDDDSYCGPSRSLSPLGITQRDWRDVANDADGVWVWPEPGNPDSVWNVGINELTGQLGIFDLQSRQNYDVTPDVTDTNGAPLAGRAYRFNWEAPIAFSALDPGVAYFGANVVFRTNDRGRTWTVISPDLTRNDPTKQQVAGGPINTDVSGAEFYDTLLDIAPSPIDPKTIWAGTDDGLVQRTVDGGAHWQNVTPAGVAQWGRVECVEPSRTSADRAYAVVNRHASGDRAPYIFATSDGGASWTLVTAGLPADQPAHVVREDPRNPDILYAGLEQGAWISFDRGAHWQSFRLGMPSVSIHDLRVQPRANDLIAGTHGRGIWILDDLTPVQQLSKAVAGGAAALFPPPPARAWYLWWADQYGMGDTECCAPAGAFAGADPIAGAPISYYLPRSSNAPPYVEILDANGRQVNRFDGTNAPGINRVAWDLSERGPVPWEKARAWNRSAAPPPAVPGSYVVRLHADGGAVEQPLELRPDPRAQWTQAQYVARRDFVRALDDELSQIDVALNRLDGLRANAATSKLPGLDAVYAQFTSNPVNSEDDMYAPDRVRERITILLGDVALSQGPPLPPHEREAAAIRDDFDRAMTAYRSFLTANRLQEDTP